MTVLQVPWYSMEFIQQKKKSVLVLTGESLCAAKEIHALLLQYAKGNNLQKIKDDFHRECQVWSTLRHPCVVQFLGNVIIISSKSTKLAQPEAS